MVIRKSRVVPDQWEWDCVRCLAGESRRTQPIALESALDHAAEHRRFGFGPPGR